MNLMRFVKFMFYDAMCKPYKHPATQNVNIWQFNCHTMKILFPGNDFSARDMIQNKLSIIMLLTLFGYLTIIFRQKECTLLVP